MLLLQAPCCVSAGLGGSDVGSDAPKRVFLMGMGGGYDCFAAVPLRQELVGLKHIDEVFVANLSFTPGLRAKFQQGVVAATSGDVGGSGGGVNDVDGGSDGDGPDLGTNLPEGVYEANADRFPPDSFGEELGWPKNYFPELYLSRFLKQKDQEAARSAESGAGSGADGDDAAAVVAPSVFAFDLEFFGKRSAVEMAQAVADVARQLRIDTFVFVDAGVDSLIRGDEEGLGTYAEDHLSLLAVEHFDVADGGRGSDISGYRGVERVLLAAIGLGSEGGVNEIDFARNCASVQRSAVGAYHGCVSWLPQMPAVSDYLEAVEASIPVNTTINAQICSSIMGNFGNTCPPAAKGRGVMDQDVFLSPLMGVMFMFDARAVWSTKREWFLEAIRDSTSQANMMSRVDVARDSLKLVHPDRGYTGPFPYTQWTRDYNKLMDGANAPGWARGTEGAAEDSPPSSSDEEDEASQDPSLRGTLAVVGFSKTYNHFLGACFDPASQKFQHVGSIQVLPKDNGQELLKAFEGVDAQKDDLDVPPEVLRQEVVWFQHYGLWQVDWVEIRLQERSPVAADQILPGNGLALTFASLHRDVTAGGDAKNTTTPSDLVARYKMKNANA